MGFNGFNVPETKGFAPTSDKEVAMKRFPALLAMVLVLMAGTAGMASALTITFDSSFPPYPPEISGLTSITWDGTGWYDGHLWCTNPTVDSTISFASPTYVNNFQMNGMPDTEPDPGYTFGPMDIIGFDAANVPVWSTQVTFDEDHRDLENDLAWLTVDVSTAAISSIIFKARDPGGLNGEPWFYPSIDNLEITDSGAVPLPPSAWLLASGLLGLVGLRRKFSH
jgi:hypothetical protein